MPGIPSLLTSWPLLLAGSYLLGSIPFAQVLARLHGVDLRETGTGNVGAGNLSRSVGWGWGTLAAVLDGLKGLLPVALALASGLGPGASGLAGIAAVVGHNWSIFMKGRSGRGLAAAAGMVLALHPTLVVWTGLWALAGWRIGGGLAGFFGWGLLPIVSVALGRPITESLVVLLLSTVLIGRRMQGNLGDSMEWADMMRRAIFDREPSAERAGETADEPLMP